MKINFFKSPLGFKKWLSKNHDKTQELWLGFHKVHTGKSGMTYAEALDEALCFGWIDAVRKGINEESYSIRFTPRKPGSIWSNVNIRHVDRLSKLGLMQPSGLKAFSARQEKRSGIYAFEQKVITLDKAYEKEFRKNKKAWDFFKTKPPWYQRTATHWVMSAKKKETQISRLNRLIHDSESGQDIRTLKRT